MIIQGAKIIFFHRIVLIALSIMIGTVNGFAACEDLTRQLMINCNLKHIDHPLYIDSSSTMLICHYLCTQELVQMNHLRNIRKIKKHVVVFLPIGYIQLDKRGLIYLLLYFRKLSRIFAILQECYLLGPFYI